jgi:hypothetical protein
MLAGNTGKVIIPKYARRVKRNAFNALEARSKL